MGGYTGDQKTSTQAQPSGPAFTPSFGNTTGIYPQETLRKMVETHGPESARIALEENATHPKNRPQLKKILNEYDRQSQRVQAAKTDEQTEIQNAAQLRSTDAAERAETWTRRGAIWTAIGAIATVIGTIWAMKEFLK